MLGGEDGDDADWLWNRGRFPLGWGPAQVEFGPPVRSMKLLSWDKIRQLRELLRETTPPPDQLALRLQTVERDVILPVKACFILILIYNLFFSTWFDNVALPQTDAQKAVQRFFPVYLLLNLVVAACQRKASALVAELAGSKAREEFEITKARATDSNPYMQYLLARCYLDGNGTPKDERLGLEWMNTAARNGSGDAKTYLEQKGKK